MMAVLHRALFTWFLFLVFLILLVLRLDARTQWSWFIVSIPLWVYDTILLIYVLFSMISHCKNGHDRTSNSMIKKVWYVIALILKMVSQIILCIKLEYPLWNLSMYCVMIPLWLLLPVVLTDTFMALLRDSRY